MRASKLFKTIKDLKKVIQVFPLTWDDKPFPEKATDPTIDNLCKFVEEMICPYMSKAISLKAKLILSFFISLRKTTLEVFEVLFSSRAKLTLTPDTFLREGISKVFAIILGSNRLSKY